MATHILTVGAVAREASQTFAFTLAGPYTCTVGSGAPTHTVVIGDTVIEAGGQLRRVQTGRLQTYVLMLLAGIVVLMVARMIV